MLKQLFYSTILFSFNCTTDIDDVFDGFNSTNTGGNNSGGSLYNSGGGGFRPENTTNSTGGTLNSGGNSSTCIPKTCTTIGNELGGKACGFINDGCNNIIDCQECNDGQGCGIGYPASKNFGDYEPGTPNLCGGGCKNFFDNDCDSNNGSNNFYWKCSSSVLNPFPNETNTCLPEAFPVNQPPYDIWCCAF